MVTTNLLSFPRSIVVLLLSLVLVGCINEEFDDLKDFVEQVKSNPAKHIPAMPVSNYYESYSYVEEGVRNPC